MNTYIYLIVHDNFNSLTLVLQRGVATPCDFFFFLKRYYVSYTNPIYCIVSQICIEIWRCRMCRGVVKAFGRGGCRNSMILILFYFYNISIWQDNACNLICGLELAFPYLFCQKARENRTLLYTIFQPKIDFSYSLCILSGIVNITRFSRAHFHYDVIVKTGGIFWCQWKEETHSYTLVVNMVNIWR